MPQWRLQMTFLVEPAMKILALHVLQVQDDIVSSLQLRNPRRLISSFDRPNIHYQVQPLKEAEETVPIIARTLQRGGDNGRLPCAIIYTLKRESADDIAARLQAAGVLYIVFEINLLQLA